MILKSLPTIFLLSTILHVTQQSPETNGEDDDKRIVCYYTNWSGYRLGEARFRPEDIDPHLCTHLIYAFVGIEPELETIVSVDTHQDITLGGFKAINNLKKRNPKLKTLVGVGGWNEGSKRFSAIARDPVKRRQFASNIVAFLETHGFDGADIAWQYPAFRLGSLPQDKQNFALLIKELNETFARQEKPLVLSLVIAALDDHIQKGFDIPTIEKYVSFVNMIGYDYYWSTEAVVQHHSPLYPLLEHLNQTFDSQLNANASITNLISKGLSPQKINLGIPTYGRLFTLEDPNQHHPGSPAGGRGKGNTTYEPGYTPYNEICKNIRDEGWTTESYNATAMGPYAFKNNLWVGYDDEESVKLKASYALKKNLGGIMFWTIDHDDFKGICTGVKSPLIQAGKEVMLRKSF